jgi:endoglucanase
LANRYKNQPAVCGFDLVNEPYNCTWDNNANTGWPAAAERCANAIHAVNPNLLIFVEGVAGQVNYSAAGGSSSWGDLWGRNLTGVATRPVVLNTPNKLVYSAHDYGTVGAGSPPWLTDSHFPGFMPQIWDISFGYITKNNIAPIFLGEFGGNFNPPNSIDQQWITALCSYINTNNIHWAYWSLNPGTQPNGIFSLANDWKTVQQAQLDAISTLISA